MPCLHGRVHLAVDQGVVLPVELPALRVPDEDVAAAELGEHRARHVAGVGAGLVRRQVLRAVHHLQPVAVDERLHAADVGERRQHRHLDPVVVLLGQRERELLHQGDGLEVVEVHLPVARDQRRPGHQALSRTAIPGKLLALQVLQRRAAAGGDVGEPVLGQAERAHGRGRVAAADHAERALRGGVDDRLRDAAGALGERGQLEHAHRTVPEHGLRARQHLRERLDRLGPDVETLPPVRDLLDRHRARRSPRPRTRRRPPRRPASTILPRLQQTPAVDDLVGLQQRVTHTEPCAARKVKHIPPPTSNEST